MAKSEPSVMSDGLLLGLLPVFVIEGIALHLVAAAHGSRLAWTLSALNVATVIWLLVRMRRANRATR